MCLLIVKPHGKRIAWEDFEAGWDYNPDGGGIAYARNGKLHIVKGCMDKKELWKAICTAGHSPAVIHTRIATSGQIDAKNTHPFPLGKGAIALAHNGIIAGLGDKVDSNTAQLASMLDGLLQSTKLDDMPRGLEWLLEKAIGQHNKLAMIDFQGTIKIINEAAGHWADGVWFSNYSYQYDFDDSYEKYYENGKPQTDDTVPDWPPMAHDSWKIETYPGFDDEQIDSDTQALANLFDMRRAVERFDLRAIQVERI